MTTPPQAAHIAQQFVEARRLATALPDYPGPVPATLDDAYAIQDIAIANSPAPIGGWKVGRIPAHLSGQYGADRLAGPIFADTISFAEPGSTGRIFAQGFGAAEAEFLLRIGTAPAPGKTSFTLEEAAAHIDAVHIGIEIASSPFPGINTLGPAVTISDFGNNNGLLIGAPVADWQSGDFAEREIRVMINDALIGTGIASAFPDGPIGSVRFLLENLSRRGLPITPGLWISSGAITGVHPVDVDDRVRADFGSLGGIDCHISAQTA